MSFWPLLRACGGIGALVLLAACGRGADSDLAAKVGDERITVDEVAEYMIAAQYGANLEDVETAVDEMVRMHLVAELARERHELTPPETLQVKEWREMLLLNQFRDDVIYSTVTVDEARLREWYDQNVGQEVKARHILIGVPEGAPDSVRQRARAKADSLRQAIAGGADFAELAREHSDDTGSGARGGALGWFGRGQMVESFEQAAFATTPGELAPGIVETQFGYHIIEVEEKRKRPFEELRDEIEEQLAMPGRQEAEQAYLTQIMETSGMEFMEGNIDRLIALVDSAPAGADPPDEVLELNLATWNGGELPLREIWDLYTVLPAANRQQIAALDQTEMIRALSSVVQQRILLDRARERSTVLDSTRQRQLEDRIDQLYAQAYLNRVAEGRVEVPDSLVREYYEGHREFYQGQPYEQVREQIRQILLTQRTEEMRDPAAQERLVQAVADSAAARVSVERYPDRYDEILEAFRRKMEEGGGETASRR